MPYEMPNPEIQGWMGGEELRWLYDHATQVRSVVEIGSWRGRSTHALLTGCRGPVFAVDHWRGSPDERNGAHRDAVSNNIFKEFWANLGHFPNLVPMRMDSHVAARFFAPASVDMVFIDGCHMKESVLVDLMCWTPKFRAIICGHDAQYVSVKEALEGLGITYQSTGGIWYVLKP